MSDLRTKGNIYKKEAKMHSYEQRNSLQKSSVQKDVNASVTTETAFATCVGFGFTLLHFLWKPVKERFGLGDSLCVI